MSQINLHSGKRVVVLGGGLSGLSYVHYLRNFLAFHKKTDAISKVTVLDANDYMGGTVKSTVFEDGVIHELGPRSIRFSGVKAKNTCALLEQLGLEDRVLPIMAKSAAGSDRYVYKEGKFWKVPTNIWKPWSKLPTSEDSIFKIIKNDLFTKKFDASKYPDGDPPLYDFIAYRFSKDTAECVLDPLLRGITSGDVRKLSTKALFNDLFEKEQTYGSVLKGFAKPPVTKMRHDELFPHDILNSKMLDKFEKQQVISYNFMTGLQTLPEHLSNSLLNTNDDGIVSIFNRTKVLEVKFNNQDSTKAPCSVLVETVDGDRVDVEADHIVSCIPANQLARLLPHSMPPEQRRALEFICQIEHVPVGCVTVEYRDLPREAIPKVLNSFGFLTHSKAGRRVLGIAFDSTMFPQIGEGMNSIRMTCMMGGEWYKEIFGTANMDLVTDTHLEQIALEEIEETLGIKQEPFRMSPYLWKTGIAQYRPGHVGNMLETRKSIETMKMPLTLLGQSYDGIAVNDVIFSSRMAADDYVKSL